MIWKDKICLLNTLVICYFAVLIQWKVSEENFRNLTVCQK